MSKLLNISGSGDCLHTVEASVYEADVQGSYRHEESGVVILKKNIKSSTVTFVIWPVGVLVGLVEWSSCEPAFMFSPLKQLNG